jgi:hypothetical protein
MQYETQKKKHSDQHKKKTFVFFFFVLIRFVGTAKNALLMRKILKKAPKSAKKCT